jgi:hypothetical protein
MAPPAVSVSIGRMSITSDTQDAPDGAVDVALRDGSAVHVRRVAARRPPTSRPFPRPYFQPGISVEQLAAQAATGPTGPTGATSDIVPPAALEPTPGPGS